MMDAVQRAEDGLNGTEWLLRGHGANRTRSYEARYPMRASEALSNLDSAISRHKVLGSFVSSTGIGQEMLVGSVDGSRYRVKFYSPIDVTVLPMTQATVWGDAVDLPDGGTQLRIQVRPSIAGLSMWLAGFVIGMGILAFGVFQFAIHEEWKSFIIAAGIALAFLAIPLLLLWWAVKEGRANERQLLERLHSSIVHSAADNGRFA